MSGMFPDSGVPPVDANNSLPNPDTVNCPDELWYSTVRCTPRFDPAAANAMLSELLNVMECADVPYDCTKLDNLCTAIKDLIGDQLYGCLPRPFPDDAGACIIEYLVLKTDASGCQTIAKHREASTQLAYATNCSVVPSGTFQVVPADPTNPATFYNRTKLSYDAVNNQINENLLIPNELVRVTFTTPCDNTVVNLSITQGIIFDPAANTGKGRLSSMVYRVDGKFLLSPQGITAFIFRATNFESYVEAEFQLQIPVAGVHTIQLYVVAEDAGMQPSQWGRSCSPGSASTGVTVSIATS